MEYKTVDEIALHWQVSPRKVTSLARQGRILGAKKNKGQWLIPSDSPLPPDGRTKSARTPIPEADAQTTTFSYTEQGASVRVVQSFAQKYRKAPQATAFTPYRVCPLGAHSDHNLGKITGFAIDRGIHIAYGPKQNGIIEIQSLQFPKRAQWHVASTPTTPQGDWADHLRGATIALHRRYPLRTGLCAVIDGELPIGGLSSSAAVIITFLSALSALNGICLSETEMITISKEAENLYVGVSCGKLDQSCEIYCRKDHLLYMDMQDDSYTLIPIPKTAKPFKIAIFFSGLERSLAGSAFNMRVDEARSAAYALKALAGLPYGKFSETNLRQVPRTVFEQYKQQLPLPWRMRAQHWYDEFDRVEQGAQAFARGDIEAFGKLCFASGKSSIDAWQTGSPELIRLYEIMCQTDGIYGGRFSGAGFKGCCMALIDPDKQDAILQTVQEQYLASFPHLATKYSAHVCNTADGVKLPNTKKEHER